MKTARHCCCAQYWFVRTYPCVATVRVPYTSAVERYREYRYGIVPYVHLSLAAEEKRRTQPIEHAAGRFDAAAANRDIADPLIDESVAIVDFVCSSSVSVLI